MGSQTTDKPKAYIVDTNVLIHDPQAINSLREGGNKVFIPFIVIVELNRLKNAPDIGFDAREALRQIEELTKQGDKTLDIKTQPSFRTLKYLSPREPDHLVIATAKAVQNGAAKDYSRVVLITKDTAVRIAARSAGLETEDYWRDQVAPDQQPEKLKEIVVSLDDISKEGFFRYSPQNHGPVVENEGVLCHPDWEVTSKPKITINAKWQGGDFTAIRRGGVFEIIPADINALDIKPTSINGNAPNWSQYIALAQLLDPDIKLVFLQGGAGTGKTLLALATAIHQRSSYRQIIVSRPMIPLEDEDRMGFLPGGVEEKMGPWLLPIWTSLSFLKEGDKNLGLVEELRKKDKIIVQPLDYIRGMTFHHYIIIVDEAQNLTPHMIKTIITRCGERTKLIFTGDLGQIDRRRKLDRNSSGLAYAMAKMVDHPLVAATNFNGSVRSELTQLAEERL